MLFASPEGNPNQKELHMAKISFSILFSIIAVFVLSSCAAHSGYSPLLRAEPEIGSTLTRAPRTLRLFYDSLPDVPRSSLRLLGPNGEHQLRGLHTMAADDLMIEILDPVTAGQYTVEWSTAVGDDPELYSGSFQFTFVD